MAALISTCGALAAEPPQPTAEAIALDESIQGLKDEALELNRAVGQIEDDYAYPAHSVITVYIGSEPVDSLLTEVSVAIDDAAPLHYSYTDSEARALLKKGLHRVLRANVEPGAHRLHVILTGKKFAATGNTPRVIERAESVFEKGDHETEILAVYGRGGKVTTLRGYKAGSKDDPRVRQADFLNADDRHFSAAVTLLQLRKQQDATKLPPDQLWRLAESYLAFGMPGRAEAAYRELSLTTTDQLALGNAQLKLAQFLYQRGFLQEAATALMGMRDKLPQPLVAAWQDLLSRALMAQGRYGDAVEVLTELKNGNQQTPYTRYNLGVALINNGRESEGETILDRVGRLPPTDTENLAIRDKANLTLGYHFLRKQQGGTAKPLFGRVRVEGPHSNRALLGLGWAELAPQGGRQKKIDIGDTPLEENPLKSLATLGILLNPARLESDVYRRAGLRSFALDKVKKKDEAVMRKALVPWAELINRDQLDPAVQEGMLAIPFALDRIGAHVEAEQFYEKATGLLEESRRRIDAASQFIREGRMVETIVRRDIDSEAGWYWRLRDLPDAPETFYLQTAIAENRYQEALKNYRDVRFLGRNFDGLKTRLDALDALYVKQPAREVSPLVLIERARSAGKPSKTTLMLRLRMDLLLSAPYYSNIDNSPSPPLQLKLASVPPHFDGARERSVDLRKRLDVLRPLVANAGAAESEMLKTIALNELAGQRKTVEKYLVEARFALARIYEGSRAAKAGGTP